MASLNVTIDGRYISALKHATDVIRSYEMDIRNSQEICGIDLVALGFCQGSIYTEAITRIAHILDGSLVLEADHAHD